MASLSRSASICWMQAVSGDTSGATHSGNGDAYPGRFPWPLTSSCILCEEGGRGGVPASSAGPAGWVEAGWGCWCHMRPLHPDTQPRVRPTEPKVGTRNYESSSEPTWGRSECPEAWRWAEGKSGLKSSTKSAGVKEGNEGEMEGRGNRMGGKKRKKGEKRQKSKDD